MVTRKKIDSFFNAVQRGDLKKVVVFLFAYESQINTGPDAFDINTKNSHGNTAIFLAACRHDPYMYEILITFGADPTIECWEGRTALSIVQQDLDMCKILNNKKRCAANTSYTGGISMEEGFLLAVDNRDIGEIATKLVKNANFYLNVRDKNGDTPAHLATHRNDFCLLELLIAFGADLNIQNNQGHTLLFIAIKNNNIIMALLLLSKGAMQDIESDEVARLTLMAFKKSSCMAKLLLRQPSARNIINNGNYRISDDDGCDLKNSDSKTPVNFAASRKRSIPCDDLPAKYRILEHINGTNNNLKDRYKMLSGEPMFPLKSLENICKQLLTNKSYFTDFFVYMCDQYSNMSGRQPVSIDSIQNNNLQGAEHPELLVSSPSSSRSSTSESCVSVCSFISASVSSNRYTPLVLNNPPRSAPATFIIPTHPTEAMQTFLANLSI